MNNKLKYIFLLLLSNFLNGQVANSSFNLGFEEVDPSSNLPSKWFTWGDYKIQSDSKRKNSGDYSVSVQSTESENFGCIVFPFPNNRAGKEIKLEGYIKTASVSGMAGLLIRIDKNGEALEFDNMAKDGLNGTNDWKKYTISVPYHNDADAIYIGGLLSGEGQVWFDDFKIYIDEIDVETMSLDPFAEAKALLDNEFDAGSKFNAKDLNDKHIKNLAELGRKWAYLKYHSAEVAMGKFNFDYEFFRILPIIRAKNFPEKLKQWEDSFTSIQTIPQNHHYYIEFKAGIGNPIFSHEIPYKDMDWNDEGIRLLALFRYWGMIQYFFPYRDITDTNWDDIPMKYISKLLSCNDEITYKLTMLELIKETNDSHAGITEMGEAVKRYFGIKSAPIETKIIDNKVIVTNLYNIPKLQIGDIILKIDDEDIDKRIEKYKKYTAASNNSALMRDVAKNLLQTNKDTIELTIKRDGKAFKINVACSQIDYIQKEIPAMREIGEDIGYIYPESLKKGEIKSILSRFKDKKGIVFDLRCYPSDFIVEAIGDYLLQQPTEFARFSFTSLENPGKYNFSPALKIGRVNNDYYKGKIAVLVNEMTQSSAEYTVMALKAASQVKVFGSQTAGANGDVSKIILPGNITTTISGIGVYYPNLQKTQRIGIIPDFEVKITQEDIINKKDKVLEQAVKYINTLEKR